MLIVLEPAYVEECGEGGGGHYYANFPRIRVSILLQSTV